MNATGSVLLDTSVVVDYFRQDPNLQEKIDQADDVYLPLVVLGELLYGAYKSKQQDKMLAQVKSFLNGVFCFCRMRQLLGCTDKSKPNFQFLVKPFLKMTFGSRRLPKSMTSLSPLAINTFQPCQA